MSALASQITSLTIVYSTVYSRRRSKKTLKLRVTGFCAENSPVTAEFPEQRASSAENVSIWWCHHELNHFKYGNHSIVVCDVIVMALYIVIVYNIKSHTSLVICYSTLPGLHCVVSLQWRHDERDCVSNHHPHDCLLHRLFRRRSKKTSKLRVAGLCAENSRVTGEFPTKMASNAEKVSIWWCHRDTL